MPNARSTSPFAAKSRKEQLEQWICWQNQHPDVALIEQLQDVQPTVQQQQQDTAHGEIHAPAETMRYRPRHSQYDAIVNRMRNARRQASTDQHWSG